MVEALNGTLVTAGANVGEEVRSKVGATLLQLLPDEDQDLAECVARTIGVFSVRLVPFQYDTQNSSTDIFLLSSP